ncbi:hypothetical protein BDZ90DRAFT_258770 [Jaminaea rosea]|uniref:t-SNARE coiled-coil homology domain-containing protein n=1 Tax=Jaminaea rosea TaxID=1569628 RepID=A0A316UX51_9BASI|nr:hypothetical protein BDZ90DRAFT_258770 [Jaminaea rosea]PWN29869.1 hypothetical protein BDZ90DRAFT_258770 [Jaminaea rosea]
MASTNLTPIFHSLAAGSSSSAPRAPRASPHRPPSTKPKALEAWHRRRQAEAQWDQEAGRLRAHIASLQLFVSNVRRAYLHSGPAPRVYGGDDNDGEAQQREIAGPSDVQSFDALSWLSEEQKDQVDLHLKLALERSVARLKEIIRAEEARQSSQPTPTTSSSAQGWARLLLAPSLSPTSLDSTEYSTQLAAHRQVITGRLGAELKRVGERVGLMQEARVRGREERSVGASARQRRKRDQEVGAKAAALEGTSKGMQGSTASFRATGAGAGAGPSGLPPDSGSSSSSGPDSELTPSQMQLFASESSALTRTLQSDLAAVESVASTLSTINELQSTLIHHLSVQGETIGHLAGEAGEQRAEVEAGNKQLLRASERGRSANRLLGALLVGSGLGVLFLHVMD